MDKKYTILYVDDETDNLLAFRSIFRRKHQILTAENGEEALQILDNEDVQLLISDQRMPGMQGTELLEQSRLKHPDLVRILLTGYTDMQAVIDAINKSKIYHYVTKPWRAEELDIIIRQALEVYELRTTNRSLTSERDQLLLKTAQQEREQVKAKFEILRNQINPHFLFNSLSILVSLIPENPQQAANFAARFAKVYRRLLEFKDTPLVSLAEELKFTEDYLYLQKIRLEESMVIEEDFNADTMSKQLPPFSLQLLLENALKHNMASLQSPLKIRISSNGNQLSVSNNLQPRQRPADSTQIGLQNLTARYKLLSDQVPHFEQTADHYKAIIPLL
ncbi:MAG: histidine kinase [Bacteroidota bacterium]